MKPDEKCIWEYYSGKYECSDCGNCPQYRPDYKGKEAMNDVCNWYK